MKAITMNPILKKELRVNARTIRFPIALMFYALAMTGAAGIVLIVGSISSIPYSYYTQAFPVMVYAQMSMVCLIIPVLTASSISGEREKQTLDIMLTTPMKPFSIVTGKLLASLSQLMLFIIASLPAMAICFIYGGMDWTNLLIFFFQTLILSLFIGSIGVMCSARYRKSITSTVVTILIEGIFFAFPPILLLIVWLLKSESTLNAKVYMGYLPALALFDPMLGYINTIAARCYGSSLVSDYLVDANGGYTTAAGFQKIAELWNYLVPVITILISLLFLWRAAFLLDKTRKDNSRQVRKMQKTKKTS